jgi:acetyl esterase
MSDVIPVLQPAAQESADATARPSSPFDPPVDEGRRAVDSVQDGDVPAPAATAQGAALMNGALRRV